ncbi:MAG TPA: cellulase family glycosylhydrolase [Chthonomonadaceae bacterium]|nr:cellulase family glycosylhydrolase [Chthonomonadaceae bacterium]
MSVQKCLLLAWLAALALPAGAQKAPPAKPSVPKFTENFLQVRGTDLWRGKFPFHNVGANLPDLFERFLHGEDAAAQSMLADAKAAGVRFARCWGTTWGPEDFGLFERDRARWLNAFDRMLTAAANDNGISVVPSLLFNINMLPEYVRRTTGKDEQVVDYLRPGSASNALAIAYVTAIVTRYKDDPRVLMWEIGNEYNLEADLSAQWKRRPANQIPTSDGIRAFLIQIATLIKRIDRRHPVTSGNSDMRPYAWHIRQAMLAHRNAPNPFDYPMDWTKDTFAQYQEMLDFFNPPPLDVISVHLYPTSREDTPNWLFKNDTLAATLPWTRTATDLLGKPLFVGEFDQEAVENNEELPMLWTHDFLLRMRLGAAPLAALWAWEFEQFRPPQPTPYTVSPQRTPALVRDLGAANQTILADTAGATLPPNALTPKEIQSPPKKVKPPKP